MNLTQRWSLIGLCFAALLGSAQAHQPVTEHFIDLISLAVTPRPSSAGVVPPGRRFSGRQSQGFLSHGKTPQAPALSVLPPVLDRGAYVLGDQVFFEVVIENDGTAPIKMPASLDAAQVGRDMPGASMLALALSFHDEVLGSQIIGQHLLYGAEPVANSLILVKPGERVRIRAMGEWLLESGVKQHLPSHWMKNLQVYASIQFTGPRGQYLVGMSQSGVSVQLR